MNNRRKTILKAYADCLGIGKIASYGKVKYVFMDYKRHRTIINTQKRIPHKRANKIEYRRND